MTQEPLIFCASVRQLVNSRPFGFGSRTYIPVGVLTHDDPLVPLLLTFYPNTQTPFLAEMIAEQSCDYSSSFDLSVRVKDFLPKSTLDHHHRQSADNLTHPDNLPIPTTRWQITTQSILRLEV